MSGSANRVMPRMGEPAVMSCTALLELSSFSISFSFVIPNQPDSADSGSASVIPWKMPTVKDDGLT